MAMREPPSRSERILFLSLLPAEAALVVGAYVAAAAHSRTGAFVMLGGFLGLLLIHLVTGISGDRRAMGHDWPSVSPVDDWDDG